MFHVKLTHINKSFSFQHIFLSINFRIQCIANHSVLFFVNFSLCAHQKKRYLFTPFTHGWLNVWIIIKDVFTSHRIFMVDMQGVTGTRQEIFVLPYRKIVHFVIQTAGFGDPLQTSELTVCYADEHEMKFGFIGQEELLAVAQAISRCIL